MTKKPTKKEVLAALMAMDAREDRAIQAKNVVIPDGFHARLRAKIKGEIESKPKEFPGWRWHKLRPVALGLLAVLVFLLGIPEVRGQIMDRFTVTDMGDHLIYRHEGEWEDKDYSKVSYVMPYGFSLLEEHNNMNYFALWSSEEGEIIHVSISHAGVLLLDYEYAEEIKEDTINGIDVIYYKELSSYYIVGQDTQFIYFVGGNADLNLVRKVFESIRMD